MAGGDYVFHFVYPAPTPTNDMRTVQVKQVVEGSTDELDFYKVSHSLYDQAFNKLELSTSFSIL